MSELHASPAACAKSSWTAGCRSVRADDTRAIAKRRCIPRHASASRARYRDSQITQACTSTASDPSGRRAPNVQPVPSSVG